MCWISSINILEVNVMGSNNYYEKERDHKKFENMLMNSHSLEK